MNAKYIRIRSRVIAVIVFAFIWPEAFGQASQPAPPKNVQQYSAAMQHASDLLGSVYLASGVPALAASISVDREIVWEQYLGYSELISGPPLEADHAFRIGSVSKAVTAVALARLWQDGTIDLDADIRRYIPDFPDKHVTITPRLLAGHLGGVRNYQSGDYEQPFNIDRRNFPTTRDALEIFMHDPLVADPGEAYHYSVYGYTLLAAAMEGAAGQDFLSILQDSVLEPLGLDATGADFGDAPGMTTAYDRMKNGGASLAAPLDLSYKWAGGGLRSNVRDLAALGGALLDAEFLSRESLDILARSQKTNSGIETNVAVGWRSHSDARSRRYIHHAGSISGGRAVILVYYDHGVSVAITSNQALSPLMIESTAQALVEPFLLISEGEHFDRIRQMSEFRFVWTARDSTHRGRLVYGPARESDIVELHPALNAWSVNLGSPVRETAPILPMLVAGSNAYIPVATAAGAFGIDVSIGDKDALIGRVTGQYVRVAGAFEARRINGAAQ